MKFPLFAAAAIGLLASAACAPGAQTTARTALDCPRTEGDLTRTQAAEDGQSCLYRSSTGDEVSLRLLRVSGGPEAALQPIEHELEAQAAEAGEKAANAPETRAGPATAADAARAAKQAEADAAAAAADAADSKEPADSRGGSDHVNIALPGIHISADDDKADVKMGMLHVDAGEDGAVVRMSRDVRLKGQAFSREKRGFRATYIVARDNLPGGFKAVGYEAGGPKAGPLAVAVVKARAGDSDHVFKDVKRLVRRNGGV